MSSPSRLFGAVRVMTTLAEGRVDRLHNALIVTAPNAQTTLNVRSIEPELLFTTPPID